MNGDLFAPLSRPNQPTSQASERELKKSGRLALHLSAALQVVKNKPGRTAKEYDASLPMSAPLCLHKRLPDLEKRGVVKRGESRRCSVSGRQAFTWWPA